jgi:hypothetical protein
MLICDDIADRYLANPYVRQAYAKHPLLGETLTARAQGLRLDPVEEAYVRPAASENERRNRIKEVHLNSGYEDLSAGQKYARKAWQSETHGRRYRRRQPKTLGLIDLASSQLGKSRLIAAKPLGETLKTALAKLTKNQRAVYQGRVVADPPRTLGDLARELQVSRKRIVALEQRSRELMALYLKGGR